MRPKTDAQHSEQCIYVYLFIFINVIILVINHSQATLAKRCFDFMAKYDMDMDMDEETLSFATMICHATPSPEHGRERLPPADPSFEFRPFPNPSFPSSPADHHLQPEAPLLPRFFPRPTEGGGSRRDLRRCLKKEADHRSGRSQKKVSFHLVATEFRRESPQPAVPGKAMGFGGRRGWAAASPGRKEGKRGRRGLFGYFMSSCRECHALEPSSQVMELQHGWGKRT
ncbi:hypothetical protein HPP92_013681 [Vanilla planifolia]|uniref:Uncharacterized protein n=1 Tax=Vanilla planifolia TaxID=51239 RepID=A0A835R3Z8_VANPL|nr:hypothetical protein HPP92_013681 [Vanilla planifolia]